MRVLVIAQYFPPDIGGSATRAHNIAKGLFLNGCDVTVIAAFPHYPHGKIPKEYHWKPFKVEWLDNMRVIRTFMPPIASKGFLRRLLLIGGFALSALFAMRLVGKFDMVWTSSWIPGIVYGKVNKKPVVINVDDLTIEDLYDLTLLKRNSFSAKIAELVYRAFYLMGDAVTPISHGYVEIIATKYHVERDKIQVVRAGVDLQTFKLQDHSSNDKFTVLYSGAFSIAYDFEQVLMAAKIVGAEDKGVEFIIQGKGELEDFIKYKVIELHLKNVKVIDKLLSRTEVAKLLNQADALILPLADFGRPYMGISSKLYEYQAVGKPIICCALGQPSDYIKETNSGIVVKPSNYEALAETILYLKKNPIVVKNLGECGRQYVENNMSLEKIGLRMKNILETMNSKDSSGICIKCPP